RVTQLEWQDLFLAVYKIHSWVDDGKKKLHAAIDYNVKEYVRMAREEMLETWKKVVFQHISLKLLSAALRLVEAERNGESVDAHLVIGVRESWVALYDQRDCYYEDVLEQYRKHFEREFVEETVAYYKKRAAQYLAENGVINYMSYADRMLEEEEQRARKYLNPNPESVARLVESCVQVLVVEFEDQILAECPSLIAKNDVENLINIKILNGGAWGRGGVGAERVRVSLPRELEEFVPEVEAFYKKHHNGRKLNWMHHWSSGTIIFGTASGGRFDLELTTFQMAVLFSWNDRAHEKISFESLRLATELPDTELARTLFSLVAYPKMKYQLLLCDAPTPLNPRDFTDSTLFYINHDFRLIKNGKEQQRGRINLIGRLQLSMESSATKEHEDIVALRELRVQEAAVKIMKMRKTITSAQLQTELVEMLKPMFIERKDDDINTFVYVS
ncbi:cullin family protein, partial [Teladorsagia circumcincta]